VSNQDSDEELIMLKEELRRKAARIPIEIDPLDPFAPVERINYSGLSPEEIRDLLAACPDSMDQTFSDEEGD